MFTFTLKFFAQALESQWSGWERDYDVDPISIEIEAQSWEEAHRVSFEMLESPEDHLPDLPETNAKGQRLAWNVMPPLLAVYTVAWGIEDRAYGGPEEGGWYFDTWVPLPNPEKLCLEHRVPFSQAFPRHFATWGEANDYRAYLQYEHLEDLNRGRAEIWSVASDGRYDVRVQLGGVPHAEPQEPQAYE